MKNTQCIQGMQFESIAFRWEITISVVPRNNRKFYVELWKIFVFTTNDKKKDFFQREKKDMNKNDHQKIENTHTYVWMSYLHGHVSSLLIVSYGDFIAGLAVSFFLWKFTTVCVSWLLIVDLALTHTHTHIQHTEFEVHRIAKRATELYYVFEELLNKAFFPLIIGDAARCRWDFFLSRFCSISITVFEKNEWKKSRQR